MTKRVNVKYRKSDGRFAHKGLNIGFGIGWLLFLAFLLAIYFYQEAHKPLVSPVFFGPTQVMAKEPEVFISCDNPKGYLECKAYSKEITWEQHSKLSKIIQCESGWNPQAINTKNKNGSYDRGLFQSNSIHLKTLSNKDAFDFKKNIDWGISLFKKQGATPWKSSIKCHGVK